MDLLEKVAYLKGMLNGMDLDDDKKETRLITAIIDVLDDLAASVADLEEETNEMCELIDILDEDLGEVEEAVFDCDCDCCDEDDFDDEMYEVTCPTCGEVLYVDEDMLDEGGMTCAACGESLEFDLEIGDCDCDCEDCDCE